MLKKTEKLTMTGVLAVTLLFSGVLSVDAQKKKKNKEKEQTVEKKVEEKTIEISSTNEVVDKKVEEATSKTDISEKTEVAENKVQDSIDPKNYRYRVGLQDTLTVDVSKHPELSLTVAISEKGFIKLPRINRPIYVVCKTETEIAEEITQELKKFLRNPFVNVLVKEQNSQPFAVIGAVETPKNFVLPRPVTLLELLTYAGGPDKDLAGTKIQVARLGGVSGCENKNDSDESENTLTATFFSYKLKDVLENRINPWLRPGDIVRVLEAETSYVVGNVVRPSKVVMKEKVTVTQAIAAAGGVLPLTKKDNIIIQRQVEGKSEPEQIAVNLLKIEKREAPDIEVLPNDIIDVPIDKGKKTRSDILKIFTGGLGNLPSVIVGRPY